MELLGLLDDLFPFFRAGARCLRLVLRTGLRVGFFLWGLRQKPPSLPGGPPKANACSGPS